MVLVEGECGSLKLQLQILGCGVSKVRVRNGVVGDLDYVCGDKWGVRVLGMGGDWGT